MSTKIKMTDEEIMDVLTAFKKGESLECSGDSTCWFMSSNSTIADFIDGIGYGLVYRVYNKAPQPHKWQNLIDFLYACDNKIGIRFKKSPSLLIELQTFLFSKGFSWGDNSQTIDTTCHGEMLIGYLMGGHCIMKNPSNEVTHLIYDTDKCIFQGMDKKVEMWTPADVPPVCWIRWKKQPTGAMILSFDDNAVYLINRQWNGKGGGCDGHVSKFSWEQLKNDFEHSIDLKTWKPCHK